MSDPKEVVRIEIMPSYKSLRDEVEREAVRYSFKEVSGKIPMSQIQEIQQKAFIEGAQIMYKMMKDRL